MNGPWCPWGRIPYSSLNYFLPKIEPLVLGVQMCENNYVHAAMLMAQIKSFIH